MGAGAGVLGRGAGAGAVRLGVGVGVGVKVGPAGEELVGALGAEPGVAGLPLAQAPTAARVRTNVDTAVAFVRRVVFMMRPLVRRYASRGVRGTTATGHGACVRTACRTEPTPMDSAVRRRCVPSTSN